MLKVDYEIQLEDGSYIKALLLNHRYNNKLKCEFITYTTIDNPEVRVIVPLKKENDTYYLDYSYQEEQLNELTNSLSLISFHRLPNHLDAYKVKKKKDKKQDETDITKLELPKIKENPSKEITKVISEEEVVFEEKNKILYIRLNDKSKMIFRVVGENKNNYICQRVSPKEAKEILDNKDDYSITYSTFNIANYYKLQGASNISTANNLNTKISKDLVIDDKEPINVLIVTYKDIYAYFIIKNEQEDFYEVEPTTFDYIKYRPYDLIRIILESEEEYKNFLDEYSSIYHTGLTMNILKKNNLNENIKSEIGRRAA